MTNRSGYVAIVGRPNVGKSTLLNRLIGQKIAITTPKPQTTRHRILGINTIGADQIVYVDTPGIHLNAKKALNRQLNRTATGTIGEVDVIVMVVEALRWTEEDDLVVSKLADISTPVILAVNKVDKIKDKEDLLPFLAKAGGKFPFAAVVPLSARRGDNIAPLEREILPRLPEGAAMFPEDQVTDRSQRFIAAELVREKLMRVLEKELPYALTVEIEKFDWDPKEERFEIAALIWVERDSQKAIVIGKGGAALKEVGRQARLDMQHVFDQRVYLQLWVKVKEGWSDDERALKSLGYDDL